MINNLGRDTILLISSNYSNISTEVLNKLLDATDVKGCKFAAIKNYCSDVSGKTEVADYVINIGAIYENMKAKDVVTYNNVNLQEVLPKVESFDYSTINLEKLKMTESQFKNDVAFSLAQALDELRASAEAKPGESGRESNDIFLNDVVVFNETTRCLSLRGQLIKKTIIVQGDKKVVASKPLTIAKKIIQNFVEARTSLIRKYKIPNMSTMNINKETITFN